MWRYVFCLLFLGGLIHFEHVQLVASKQQTTGGDAPNADVLASPGALKFLSLGYKNLVADYFWLRAVSHYGDKSMQHLHYPNLWPLLSRAQALDPLFSAPYIFAGTTMLEPVYPWEKVLQLLEEGMQQRPDLWRISFLYGFGAYFLAHSYDAALKAIGHAAEFPDAPSHLGLLALRLSMQADAPETGLLMSEAMLHQTEDPVLLRDYQKRHDLLRLEVDLKHLQAAVQAFRQVKHRNPKALEDLVGFGDIRAIPSDPLGGFYHLDNAGNVITQHQKERSSFARDNTKGH